MSDNENGNGNDGGSDKAKEVTAMVTRTSAPSGIVVDGGGVQMRTWEDLGRVTSAIARSGSFRDVHNPEQAMVKIQLGAEHGFSMMASLCNIHIIEGKPSMSAGLIAAKVKQSGIYRFVVKTSTAVLCELQFFEREDRSPTGAWFECGVVTWTIEEAKQADLLGDKKPNWKRYPSDMLFARALTRGVRRFCPDLFFGSIYTPEELGDTVDIGASGELLPPSPKQQGQSMLAAAALVSQIGDATEKREDKKAKREKPTVVDTTSTPVKPTIQPVHVATPTVVADDDTGPPPAFAEDDTSSAITPTADADDDEQIALAQAAEDEAQAQQFAATILKLSSLKLPEQQKELVAVVVANANLGNELKASMRVFSRALTNKSKGLVPTFGLADAAEKALLNIALAVDGNAIGSPL
jgi:hypothetical protein